MATRRGPDNTVRISVEGTYNGAKWANVFYVLLTTSSVPSQANLDTWTLAFGNALGNNLKAKQGASLQYTTARSTFFVPGGTVMQSVQALSIAGTQSSGFDAPAQAAICISWLSGVYWRGGKPRNYACGLRTFDFQNAVSLTATAIANWKSNADAFRTAVNALTAGAITGTSFGFVSFRSGNADRTPPLFFPISESRIHNRIDTQRRRLGRVDL